MRHETRCSPLVRHAAVTAVALLAAALPRIASAADPIAAPTTAPSARSDAELSSDLKQVMIDLAKVNSAATLQDPAKRAEAAPTAIPLIKKQSALYTEFSEAHHSGAAMGGIQQQLQAELYLYGDAETVAKVDADAKSDQSETSLQAQTTKLEAKWIAAGKDSEARKPVIEQVIKLDADHPESEALTQFTATLARSTAGPDGKPLVDAIGKMTSPLATRIAKANKAQEEAANKQASLVNKSLTLAGTTVQGNPFSSDVYKGKVVLVDFWATWCGPCKAELPRVKEVYSKYHDQGFEIIGVSNDFSADALKKFTPENNMPWVELFDAKAAAQHTWNPITEGYGIRGIPTMFLIDKKGVLRSITARAEMEALIPKLLAE